MAYKKATIHDDYFIVNVCLHPSLFMHTGHFVLSKQNDLLRQTDIRFAANLTQTACLP